MLVAHIRRTSDTNAKIQNPALKLEQQSYSFLPGSGLLFIFMAER